MLTDTSLRNWKPGATKLSSKDVTSVDKATGQVVVTVRKGDGIPDRKRADRDGMYALLLDSGTVSFRFDYRLNGRRETLVIGRYDPTLAAKQTRSGDQLQFGMDVTLAEARLLLARARQQVQAGESPSRAKVEQRTEAASALTFAAWAGRYFTEKGNPKNGAPLAASTLAMRRSTYERVLEQPFGRLKLEEITPSRVKDLCMQARDERGPAVGVHAREIVLAVFNFARQWRHELINPAEFVRASEIAKFEARDRFLEPSEIRQFLQALDRTPTMPTLRLALRVVMLTAVRKGEFIGATWDEIDFEARVWRVPASRMKARREHVIYLSEQAVGVLRVLRDVFSASQYLHPGRYESDIPISDATLNRVIDATVAIIRKDDPSFEPFSVHDLRRTFSTLTNRAKFRREWIEMCLAHAKKDRIEATYNVAQFAAERRILMQAWADMIDAWERGESARDIAEKGRRDAEQVLELDSAEAL
jgi:integrase